MKCDSCGLACQTFDEIDVREIDEYGDSQDVDQADGIEDAKRMARQSLDCEGVAAVVVERHWGQACRDCGIRTDEYETLATFGDEAALEKFGA